MAYFRDLREFLGALEKAGKLVRVKRAVNKDTELHPLVRLQFRGLPESERKAFLFEKVTDSKGKVYRGSVGTCVAAPNTEIYCMAMKCRPEEISEKWAQARLHPVPPRVTASGAAQEEVHAGDKLLEHGGLGEFPFTISTPGYDAGPYLTAPCWVSKDPETGQVNVGTYRAHVKSATRTGVFFARQTQHMAQHWAKARRMGKPLQVAVMQGVAPHINYVSVAKLAYGENEYAVAGGLAGEPVEVIKCRSVDLEVCANAEIVIEGELSITDVEPEGPFGETFGYMGEADTAGVIFNVKCITHRKDPVTQSFFSEFPPSESTKIRGIARATSLYKTLRHDLAMPHVLNVVIHDDTSAVGVAVITIKRGTAQDSVWQTLEKAYETLVADPLMVTKLVIAVDDDIDPQDAGSVNWAMTFRMQPHRDVRVHTYPAKDFHDWGMSEPSLLSPEEEAKAKKSPQNPPVQSKMLINATMKWDYRPLSLPKKEFMEKGLALWRELKLPPLNLRQPWWGHKYALWSDDEEKLAELAVRSEWEEVGELLAKRRKKLE